MFKRPSIRILITLLLLAALGAAVTSWQLTVASRHDDLNLALAAAIAKDDLVRMRQVIHLGADANIRETYHQDSTSILDRFKRLFQTREHAPIAEGYTALIRAAAHGDVDFIRFLLAKGANPNMQIPPGITALHLAAGMGDDQTEYDVKNSVTGQKSYDACKLLLEAHADPNINNKFDGPPLRAAIGQKNEALEKLFFQHGAKWNIQDRFTITALWDAVQHDREWLVSKFLAEGANPNERETRHKITVLMQAAAKGNVAITKMLLDAGADPNALDDGQICGSPLIAALDENPSIGVVKLLLEHGAKPDLMDSRGRNTPLSVAQKVGKSEFVELFEAVIKRQHDKTMR